MALQVAVSRLDWPWPAKFAAILAVALPLMFASYELVVRHSFIGLVLNGRRVPRSAAMRPEGPISSTPQSDSVAIGFMEAKRPFPASKRSRARKLRGRRQIGPREPGK